jgi:hypothetical protein
MDDNERLMLGTSFDADDDVKSGTSTSQALNASTPADVESTALLDVIMQAEGNALTSRDSISGDDDILFLPLTIDIMTDRDAMLPLDTRLASSRWTADDISGQIDLQLHVASHLRNRNAYLTIVDMLGHGQPGAHHLLKEGGSGFITYENGNRILIL